MNWTRGTILDELERQIRGGPYPIMALGHLEQLMREKLTPKQRERARRLRRVALRKIR